MYRNKPHNYINTINLIKYEDLNYKHIQFHSNNSFCENTIKLRNIQTWSVIKTIMLVGKFRYFYISGIRSNNRD